MKTNQCAIFTGNPDVCKRTMNRTVKKKPFDECSVPEDAIMSNKMRL